MVFDVLVAAVLISIFGFVTLFVRRFLLFRHVIGYFNLDKVSLLRRAQESDNEGFVRDLLTARREQNVLLLFRTERVLRTQASEHAGLAQAADEVASTREELQEKSLLAWIGMDPPEPARSMLAAVLPEWMKFRRASEMLDELFAHR